MFTSTSAHVFKKSSIAKQAKNWRELTAQQPELSYPLTSSLYCLRGIVWGCGLKETMTSKYVTESRAGHVTFPRVFPIGLWGVRYSLYYILLLQVHHLILAFIIRNQIIFVYIHKYIHALYIMNCSKKMNCSSQLY